MNNLCNRSASRRHHQSALPSMRWTTTTTTGTAKNALKWCPNRCIGNDKITYLCGSANCLNPLAIKSIEIRIAHELLCHAPCTGHRCCHRFGGIHTTWAVTLNFTIFNCGGFCDCCQVNDVGQPWLEFLVSSLPDPIWPEIRHNRHTASDNEIVSRQMPICRQLTAAFCYCHRRLIYNLHTFNLCIIACDK